MALEQQLSLIPNASDGNGADGKITADGGGDDNGKTPRLPRWTRQEILVLIQGKKVAENRVRRGRTAGAAFGGGQIEPKWASVSSYCKRHGVNRGPVQCRKRWSNLAGDYKKIKEWESQIREETESFWVMRNDLRREKKLPGFFDREVYDILDGTGGVSAAAFPPGLNLALAPASAAPEEEAEAVFDSGRTAAAEDGLFSDFEQEETGGSPKKEGIAKDFTPLKAGIANPTPISEKQYQPSSIQTDRAQGKEKQPATNPEVGSSSHDTRKRKRFTADGDDETTAATNLQSQLIDVLERNGKMVTAQLEAQNNGLQLDREQRKDHADSLVAVLNKLADALVKIADKL